MTNEQQLALKEARRHARRRSHRMALASVVVAGFYLFGSDLVLNGGERWHIQRDGIRYVNKLRASAMILFPLPARPGSRPPGVGLFLPGGTPPRPGSAPTVSPEQQQVYAQNAREVGAVVGATDLWQQVVWGLCLGLLGVALLSWITPWGRFFHLLAALAIILTTFFSLACLHYLEISDTPSQAFWPLSAETYSALTERWHIPKGGGLGNLPDAPRTYLALSALLSTYGWVLVGVFARRIRPEAVSEESLAPPSEEA